MTDKMNWDEIPEDNQEEKLSDQDHKNAESMGKKPVGKYLVTVEETNPKQINPKDRPSYFAANLKMRIDDVIEIEGKPASEEDKERWEGKFLFDSVSLYVEGESEALKNRRILVLKRGGVITNSAAKIPKDAWSKQIIGKQYLINWIEDSYKDKNGNDKTIRKVAFDGYESPEAAVKVTEDDLDDI